MIDRKESGGKKNSVSVVESNESCGARVIIELLLVPNETTLDSHPGGGT